MGDDRCLRPLRADFPVVVEVAGALGEGGDIAALSDEVVSEILERAVAAAAMAAWMALFGLAWLWLLWRVVS